MTPHVTASELMSRSVLHVAERSIAPRRFCVVGVPSGSCRRKINCSDAARTPGRVRNPLVAARDALARVLIVT